MVQTSHHIVETPSIADFFNAHTHSIATLLDTLVRHSFDLRASDIHIHPERTFVQVRIRVDGVLAPLCTIPHAQYQEYVSRVKICARLRTDEHQTPHDGRFCVAHTPETSIDIRVSIVPTYHGESIVLRLLAESRDTLSLESLGFSKNDTLLLIRALEKHTGMILTTGPTGSGKTTTLYALMQTLHTPEVSIVTIEDPIEYSLPGIKQIQVNHNTGLTFASGLKSIVRQDPNSIMVGEIRDHETASLAINTALTGHLLLSTLHTTDAATTIPRLLDLSIEPYLIASTVSLVVGQRLVRKICPHCTYERRLTDAEKKHLSTLVPDSLTDTSYAEGAGCDNCLHTGFRGRTTICEILVMHAAMRDAIIQRASSAEIDALARAHGMTPMLQDGYTKVQRGITTLRELFRVVQE